MATAITAIIVDDEQDSIGNLNRIIKNEINGVDVIASVNNAKDALEIIIDDQPDLVFLDIKMPVNDGFWLADKLNKIKSNSRIIFTTAYDEYAIEAIKYAAFDFLTKPIVTNLLIASIERYKNKSDTLSLEEKVDRLTTFFNKDKLKFKTQTGFFMVSVTGIMYCVADRNYTNIYTADGRTEIVTTYLKEVKKLLPEKLFIKVNRSTIININYIKYYNHKKKIVTLDDITQEIDIAVSLLGSRRLLKI